MSDEKLSEDDRAELAEARALLADIGASVTDAARRHFSRLSQPLEDRLTVYLAANPESPRAAAERAARACEAAGFGQLSDEFARRAVKNGR